MSDPDVLHSQLQALYRDSSAQVRGSYADERTAEAAHGRYVAFLTRTAPAPAALLDVGCGDGWSTALFARAGYTATGVDLNARAFAPPPRHGLELREGSALSLPFDDATFDVVATNQMLEHVPDPARALAEMARVLRPGGVLCVVGPNLLSLGMPLRGLAHWAWRNRPVRTIFVRAPGMPHHPFGNTLPENLAAFVVNARRITAKLRDDEPSFTLREPDLVPPFTADNDACYVLNPIDLRRFFTKRGFEILRDCNYGMPAWGKLLASGTYFAARKGAGRAR